jgi:hypothetical protein
MHRNILNRFGKLNGPPESVQEYWTPQRIADTFLFYGETSKITDGKLYNQVAGRTSEYLTVGGSAGSETYQAPNNATYQTADVDNIWFTEAVAQRTVTTTELIGFDLQRTPVKYDDDSPNAIKIIGILKTGVVIAETLRDQLFKLLELPVLWDNSLNAFGHVKSNRIIQNLFPGVPTGLTLTLISGGVKIDWTDNSFGLGETEIWGKNDSAEYALIDTIAAGTFTKSETITPVDLRYYKIRNKQDGIFSSYTDEQSIALLGNELAVNSGFESETGWTISGGTGTAAVSGGVLTLTSANGKSVYQERLTIGKSYRHLCKFNSMTEGWVDPHGEGFFIPFDNNPANLRSKVAIAANVDFGFYISVPTSGVCDYYSVKEVLLP